MLSRRKLGVFGSVVLIVGGCREATPPETSAHYTLLSVDGQPVPAIIFQGSSSTGWVTRGEVTLGPGDRFLLVISDSSDSPLLPELAETDSLTGRYRVADAGYVFSFAPPESGASYADTGDVSADEDTLRIRTRFPIGVSGGLPTRLFLYVRQ